MMQVAARPGTKLGSLSIPNDRVGRLIGPRGAVINKLRDDTGLCSSSHVRLWAVWGGGRCMWGGGGSGGLSGVSNGQFLLSVPIIA